MTSGVMRMSIQEVCACEGVSRQWLVSIVEHEIVSPVAGSSVEEWLFDIGSVAWARKAIRLRRDLELDWVAVAMVVDLLQQQERLQQENRNLQQRLQRFLLED